MKSASLAAKLSPRWAAHTPHCPTHAYDWCGREKRRRNSLSGDLDRCGTGGEKKSSPFTCWDTEKPKEGARLRKAAKVVPREVRSTCARRSIVKLPLWAHSDNVEGTPTETIWASTENDTCFMTSRWNCRIVRIYTSDDVPLKSRSRHTHLAGSAWTGNSFLLLLWGSFCPPSPLSFLCLYPLLLLFNLHNRVTQYGNPGTRSEQNSGTECSSFKIVPSSLVEFLSPFETVEISVGVSFFRELLSRRIYFPTPRNVTQLRVSQLASSIEEGGFHIVDIRSSLRCFDFFFRRGVCSHTKIPTEEVFTSASHKRTNRTWVFNPGVTQISVCS